jgi:putrescine transport system substrate-binding protein
MFRTTGQAKIADDFIAVAYQESGHSDVCKRSALNSENSLQTGLLPCRSRSLLAVLLFVLGFCVSFFPAIAQERTLSVYGWADYIDSKVIEDFTKETGIKVTYDAYDSVGTLEKRLGPGKAGFDVVIVPGDVLQRQIAAGLYQKLDKSKLPNGKNLWPDVMTRLQAYDPGNQYAVSYMWFTAGIAYNVDKVMEALGDTAAGASRDASSAVPVSWGAFLQVDNLKKFAGCGVTVLDSWQDMFAIALIYLKGDPSSMRWIDFKHAAELLNIMRRNVKKFESAGYADALVSGDICLAIGYSMDSIHAHERAEEAENGIEIGYVIPKEGSLILLDNLAIPKDAAHVAEAYAFIDFLLRPEIAARNTNFTHLASGVLASKSGIDKDIAENKSIFPGDAMMQRLYVEPSYDPSLQKIIEHEWARIKAGN